MNLPDYLPFATWSDVLTYVKGGEPLFYQGPLDVRPGRVRVRAAYKNGKLRLEDYWHGTDNYDRFTADHGHLSRFRYQQK